MKDAVFEVKFDEIVRLGKEYREQLVALEWSTPDMPYRSDHLYLNKELATTLNTLLHKIKDLQAMRYLGFGGRYSEISAVVELLGLKKGDFRWYSHKSYVFNRQAMAFIEYILKSKSTEKDFEAIGNYEFFDKVVALSGISEATPDKYHSYWKAVPLFIKEYIPEYSDKIDYPCFYILSKDREMFSKNVFSIDWVKELNNNVGVSKGEKKTNQGIEP